MSDAQARANLAALLEERGARTPYGWKVAINAEGAQRRLGLSHALAAPLDDSRIPSDDGRVSIGGSSQIYLEAEIALVLAEDLGAVRPLEALRASVAAYTPALELVDYALSRADLKSMLAHRFFHRGVVLGTAVAAPDFVPMERPYPQVKGAAGVVRARAEGAVPDDVVLALQALSERVFEAGGKLSAGQIVMCGSYIDPVPFPQGAELAVDFGPQLGAITIARA